MNPNGRTIAEDIANGTAYRLHGPRADKPGTWDYWPPACDTPAEVAACYLAMGGEQRGTMKVDRVIGGSIGCLFVEAAGTIDISDAGAKAP